MKITNRSDYGDLEVGLLRRVVVAGETVDVTADQARRLLPQQANWAPGDDEARKLAEQLEAGQDAPDEPSDEPAAVDVEPGDSYYVPGVEAAYIAPAGPPAEPVVPDLPVERVEPPPTEDAEIGELTPPAPSALKGEWEAYVEALGYDPAGKTKQELIDLASAAPASNPTEA